MHCCHYEASTYDGECWCTGCLPEGVTQDSEQAHPIFADSEWDYYPVCHACGREHDYVSLTEYGQRQLYLRLEREPVRKLREQHNGELPAFAWPGGYPMLYLTACNGILCADCATKHTDERDPVEAWDIHWEGPPESCEECNREIESAYGDPAEEQKT
jgi:hypothetical protein